MMKPEKELPIIGSVQESRFVTMDPISTVLESNRRKGWG